jgi:hypothetical protein
MLTYLDVWQAAKNKVVMRFIDVRNSNLGYILADFTKCDWEGWVGHSSGGLPLLCELAPVLREVAEVLPY